MKICKKCNQEKSIDQFRFIKKNKNGTDLYKARCEDCYNKFYIEKYRNKTESERKEIYQKKIEKTTPEIRKNWRLQSRYGITLEEVQVMLQQQNNSCYICGTHIEGKNVKVDHCHRTKKVRKLLCHSCNTALGHLREDKNLFEKCIDYLEQHDSI
jgi:hypothetical protein